MQTKIMSMAYMTALQKFITRLSKHQFASAHTEDPSVTAVFAVVEGGRRYDKILIQTTRKHPSKPGESQVSSEVRYFVERATGNIYGAKSPLAPNETRYFGTVYNAKKWNWKGMYGENVSDASVVEVGAYGGVKHYAPVKTKKVTVGA